MVRAPEGTCSHGGGLLRRGCGREAVGSCVYCGRMFCAAHGRRGADYADTCSRRPCRAKLRDVEAHVKWKQQVGQSNRVAVCAREQCSERMRHRCSRCHLMFCEEHVRLVRAPTGRSTRRMARTLICGHCFDRRRLWD